MTDMILHDSTVTGDESPVITADHLAFLRGLRGHTWISDYMASEHVTEAMLEDVIAYVEAHVRAEGWIL